MIGKHSLILFAMLGLRVSSFISFGNALFQPACTIKVVSANRVFSRLFCEIIPTPEIIPQSPVTELSRLEIRVGKIVEICKHPEADNIYVEKVDIGEVSGPRTIASGLVQYVSAENLLNKKVIVLCNLKPRAIKGITSFGMLLCSSSADHTQVEPLSPPVDAELGDLITFEGHKPEPAEAGNRASKAYSKISEDFFVNDDGIATYQGIPFMINGKGLVTSSLKGKIS